MMIFSFLNSIQKRRSAARNFRVLSALDDEMLHDIGLDRRTLHTFCDNGCTHGPAVPSRQATSRTAVMSGVSGIAFR